MSATSRTHAPQEADITRRRERKRATDRAAQREHRRRQKLYIEDLEAQLALVRDGSLDDQLAQVMRENDKLRTELERYRAFFNNVEDLVMDEWQHDNNAKRKEQAQPPGPSEQAATRKSHSRNSLSPRTQQQCSPNDTQNPAKSVHGSPPAVAHVVAEAELPAISMDASMGKLVTEAPSWNHYSPPGAFDWATSSFSFEQNGIDLGSAASDAQLQSIVWDDPMGGVAASRPDLSNPVAAPFLSPVSGIHNEFQHLESAASYPTLMSNDMGDFNSAVLLLSQQQTAPLIHQLLPEILEPDTPRDERIQSIIKRAQAQGTRLGPPTLADFLCENPDNVLSMAIKHYLEPVRVTRRLMEFLATYWVLYLILRWQINRDEESFYNLPLWLRPTVTQKRVHHPLATDLLAWPLLRDEVIMISLKGSQQAHEILTDVGIHLEIDIPLNKFSLMEDGGFLHAAIADLNNWKLADAFFVKYPALRPLYDASFHTGSQGRNV